MRRGIGETPRGVVLEAASDGEGPLCYCPAINTPEINLVVTGSRLPGQASHSIGGYRTDGSDAASLVQCGEKPVVRAANHADH